MTLPPQIELIPIDIAEPSEIAVRETTARGPWALDVASVFHDKAAILSVAFIAFIVVFALSAPLIESWTGHPKNTSNSNGYDPLTLLPVTPFHGCSSISDVGNDDCFVLGTSNVSGYDMLVQLAYGARTSLTIGLVATALTLTVALTMGVVAGYSGGTTDSVISRIMDVVAAFPFLLFAIAVSTVFPRNMRTVILIIVFFSWFYPARLFRAEVLSIREREFVAAARMLGSSTPRILRKHILPHLIGPAIVYSTLAIATAILFEAALSFLALGLPVDVPSWGRMVSEAVPGGLYRNAPHLMLIPGTMLVMTALAFNLLGDGLRDALDPKGNVDA